MPSPSWTTIAEDAPHIVRWPELVISFGFLTLATIAITLRWYVRLEIMKKVMLDDYFVIAAFCLSIASMCVSLQENHDAAYAESEAALVSNSLRLMFINNLFFQVLINLTKASIVIQYHRVFKEHVVMRRICLVIFVLLLGAVCFGVFGAVFLCAPVRKAWHQDVPGYCGDAQLYWDTNAAINAAMDLTIWVSPMPVIGRLRMPTRQKVGLCVVLGLGGIVCIVSILRLTLVNRATEESKFRRSGTYAMIWSAIEANVGIICACLLAIKPFLQRFFPRLVEPGSPSRRNAVLRRMKWRPWRKQQTEDSEKTAIDRSEGEALDGRLSQVSTHVGSLRSSKLACPIHYPYNCGGDCVVDEDVVFGA